jgi:hypothetical protein
MSLKNLDFKELQKGVKMNIGCDYHLLFYLVFQGMFYLNIFFPISPIMYVLPDLTISNTVSCKKQDLLVIREQIDFHSKRLHTSTKMNDNINMDSTKAWSMNAAAGS